MTTLNSKRNIHRKSRSVREDNFCTHSRVQMAVAWLSGRRYHKNSCAWVEVFTSVGNELPVRRRRRDRERERL